MNADTTPEIRCSEIRDTLYAQDSNEVYFHYSNWVKILVPFWEKAIVQIAENTGFYQEKAIEHLNVARSAFDKMDGWRSGNVKIVKARRKEIDSAISYIRNGALLANVSDLVLSPICRNAASALRSCLNLASGSYSDTQLPVVIAQQIYSIAAVKTLFPVDDADLIRYLPGNVTIHGRDDPKDLDNYHLMFKIAAEQLDLSLQINAMNKEAAIIWKNFKQPFDWEIPDIIWTEKTGSLSTQLYYANRAAFYAQRD